jgi:hypothetical protein
MHEIRLECLACGAHPAVPMSDQYRLPDGTVVKADDLADDAIADAVRDYLQGMPCPRCGSDQLRVTLPFDVI